jgi:putative phosphoesterase
MHEGDRVVFAGSGIYLKNILAGFKEIIIMIAVFGDVHSNSRALEAVLEDIQRRSIRTVVNLGDSLLGPMNQAATTDLLINGKIKNISGNGDRFLHTPTPEVENSLTYQYTMRQLWPEHLEWLRSLNDTLRIGDVLFCHGTPTSDRTYLLEKVTEHGVSLRPPAEIGELLGALPGAVKVVCCGHTHIPRTVRSAEGVLIVNPGSAGVPAYTEDDPFPHAMEAGSPHARYAILEQTDEGEYRVEHVQLVYDWQSAAAEAKKNGFSEYARWIATGRA